MRVRDEVRESQRLRSCLRGELEGMSMGEKPRETGGNGAKGRQRAPKGGLGEFKTALSYRFDLR